MSGDAAVRTALKEWAVLVDAMAAGAIAAMVRKGGIREQRAGFSVRHERFLFYPTYFHEKAQELAPRFRESLAASQARRPPDGTIRIAHVADVVGLWAVSDLERLRAIERFHGLDWSAVQSRFYYKDRPGVQIVAVRVSRLPVAAMVAETRRYQGCVSWVALDADVDVTGAVPALDEQTLASAVAAIDRALR